MAFAATDLATRMRSRAEVDSLAADHPLRVLADKYDRAAEGFFSPEGTVKVEIFMGSWARARRAWCDYTGESLI